MFDSYKSAKISVAASQPGSLHGFVYQVRQGRKLHKEYLPDQAELADTKKQKINESLATKRRWSAAIAMGLIAASATVSIELNQSSGSTELQTPEAKTPVPSVSQSPLESTPSESPAPESVSQVIIAGLNLRLKQSAAAASKTRHALHPAHVETVSHDVTPEAPASTYEPPQPTYTAPTPVTAAKPAPEVPHFTVEHLNEH